MRRPLAATAIILVIAFSACGDDDDDDAASDTAATTATSASIPDIVGESVEDATATLEDAGFTLRVIRRDGEDLPATADFVENRVNVAVETQDGTEVVTEVISTG